MYLRAWVLTKQQILSFSTFKKYWFSSKNSALKQISYLLKMALRQKVQDSFFIANFGTINIPFQYLKLLHPLHGIDKMSIFKTFSFTCFIYLRVQEVGFMSSTNNFISQRYFKHTNEPYHFPFIVTFTTIVFFKPKKYQIILIICQCHVLDVIVQDSKTEY